ncbi:hypothetical protein CAC42_2310 [Sphaceloma murrayae]|uniref:U1-type domain-containing protein n=1 Tax=Sphaceloma murrayae TaxID=2082308 RepID=A0A2K1QJF4_9PEZI|nr:hypothetical protein CAC42_2310 [Sphaceloma murrayae]
MADARTLLQSSRAARRITHPYARYTDSGKLLCSLCDAIVKSESSWNGHLKTAEHAKRALRAAEALKARNSKKRKAGSEDEEDTRKRVRGTDDSDEDEEQGARAAQIPRIEVSEEPDRDDPMAARTSEQDIAVAAPTIQTVDSGIENDPEWLELQQMLNTTAADPKSSADVYANATISAAPMTAEELAAQAREEQSTQRGRREAELEEEKEDAQEALQVEFEEMDELEARVRKLREKREALRPGSATVAQADVTMVRDDLFANRTDDEAAAGNVVMVPEVVPEEDEDDDDADLDDWNFGAD